MSKNPSTSEIKPLTNVTHVELASRAHDIRAGLIDTFLNLEKIDTNLYLARHLLKGRNSYNAVYGGQVVWYNAVYGGQVVGQSLAAAAATVEERFVPHSLHSYFIKQGNVNKPILYMIDPVRNGRSFCTRIVKAVQDGAAIYTCQISFHINEENAVLHQHIMPQVKLPELLKNARNIAEDYISSEGANDMTKRLLQYHIKEIPPAFARVFDVRPVEGSARLLTVNNENQAHAMIWIKAKESIGDDHRLHQCVAAYLTDMTMLLTALRPHMRNGFVPSMSFSLDHCIWIHETHFRVDDWMLYETTSSKANGSRAHIQGRLWTKDGKLAVSTAQEGLIRKYPSSNPEAKL